MALPRDPRPGLPSSPWATRFTDPDHHYEENGTVHSGLAPIYPRVEDPKYYGDLRLEALDQPGSNKEMDRLFWHEETQNQLMGGLETWEAEVLNRHVSFKKDALLSAGHDPADKGELEKAAFESYTRDGLQVDEKSWLPFLQKSRWFDWSPAAPFNQNKILGKDWSVDEPAVWDAMKPSIELANRILEAMIRELHDGEDWNEVCHIYDKPRDNEGLGNTVLMSPKYEWVRAEALGGERMEMLNWIDSSSSADWRQRLNDLLAKTIWSFLDTTAINSWATTISYFHQHGGAQYDSVITINTYLIRKLVENDFCLGEVCALQVYLAVAIIHELMHATVHARMHDRDRGYVGNAWDRALKRSSKEPYLDAYGVNEVGRYMEHTIFGGAFYYYASRTDRAKPEFQTMLGMGIIEVPFPGLGERLYSDDLFALKGAITTVYHVGSIWFSRLLSEQFWDLGDVRRKSDNFFWRYPLLIGQSPNVESNRRPRRWVSPRVQSPSEVGWSTSSDEIVLNAFNQRRTMMKSLRAGWHLNAKSMWDLSPWGDWFMRDMNRSFADAFAKRDEEQCTTAARNLIKACHWNQDWATYQKDFPSSTYLNANWAWHCLLMFASLPIRRDETTSKRATAAYQFTLLPSRSAVNAGYAEPCCENLNSEEESTIWANEFWYKNIDNSSNWERKDPLVISHNDYIRRVSMILDHIIDKEALVHRAFHDAINAAYNRVRDARAGLAMAYPNGADQGRWLPNWDFELPEYDHRLTRYNKRTRDWRTLVMTKRIV
ncbi:hypothetical protein F5Y16DRAFT_402177 [Xylariaceae sp. FL0255]|nr:hypothetical protein F5Y16DRAFT_402177 [Xylariaceae sp. FL0255]